MGNKGTFAIVPAWDNAPPKCVIFCSVCQAGVNSQKVVITGPYTGSAPTASTPTHTFQNGSMDPRDFGKQIGKFFQVVQYQQWQAYKFDMEFTNNGGNPSSIDGEHSQPISDKAYNLMVLSNDSGGDNDFNDLVVSLTMYKQSTD